MPSRMRKNGAFTCIKKFIILQFNNGGTDGGTLTLGASNILPGTTVNIYAGTLDLNTRTDAIGALNLGGGASGTTANITGSTGTLSLGGNLTYDATNNAGGATISANLSLNGANRTFTVNDSTAAASDLTISGVVEGMNLVGSTQVQGRATLAGNLCNGSPAADSVPGLIAAGAVATITGPKGSRDIPVEQVPAGPGRTNLAKGEVISAITLPPRWRLITPVRTMPWHRH